MAPYKNHFNIKQTIQAYEKFCHKSVVENIKKKHPFKKIKFLQKTVNFYKELLMYFRAYVKSRDVLLLF